MNLDRYTKTLAKFKVKSPSGEYNEIEVYTTNFLMETKSCIVFDRSCILERKYTIGKDAFLNWDQFEKGYKPLKSFQEVIDAWKNREIHF
jgi:hypothetical protein